MKKFLFILLVFPILAFGQDDKIGIYYQYGDSVIKINPTKSSGYKTNTLGTALTMGIASSKMVIKFRGESSMNKLAEPSFVFFFQPVERIKDITNYFNFTASHMPNNFILVKLDKRGKSRELNWGKINVYSGTDMGIPEDNSISFEVISVDELSYVVKPLIQLKKGEYAFVFDGANGSGAFMPIFDFSVN